MPIVVLLPLALVCSALILYRYYRIGRLVAGIGWTLLIVAIASFGSGLAESFTWAGFVFLFLAGLGMVILIQESIFRRRRRQQS